MTGHFHIYSREYSREYYSRAACAVLDGYDTTSYGSSMHSWIGSVYDKTRNGDFKSNGLASWNFQVDVIFVHTTLYAYHTS